MTQQLPNSTGNSPSPTATEVNLKEFYLRIFDDEGQYHRTVRLDRFIDAIHRHQEDGLVDIVVHVLQKGRVNDSDQ